MKHLLLLISALMSMIASAQNLVPNPSFEDYTECPNYTGQINQASPWFMPLNTGNASSDLFNECNPAYVNVPATVCGYQNSHSGAGYAGIFTHGALNAREYLEVQLTTPLIAGHSYQVEMYVNAADESGVGCDAIGIYISMDSVSGDGTNLPLMVTPQISNPAGDIISDTVQWTLVSGTYTATGGESYLTIGNFLDDVTTQTEEYDPNGWGRGYYFVDDVSVTDMETSSIDDQHKHDGIYFYPNPAIDKLYIETNTADNIHLELFDMNGFLVFNVNVNNKSSIDVTTLENGIYTLVMNTNSRTIQKKIVIMH